MDVKSKQCSVPINSQKDLLTRKPSFKNKKPPEVKQTLTSKYRLLKANPLLQFEQENKLENFFASSTNRLTLSNRGISKTDSTSNKSEKLMKQSVNSNVKILERFQNQNTIISGNNPKLSISNRSSSFDNIGGKSKIDFSHSGQIASSTRLYSNSSYLGVRNCKRESIGKPPKVDETERPSIVKPPTQIRKPLRRSLSAQHFDKKQKHTQSIPEICLAQSQVTQSMDDIRPERTGLLHAPDVSPIVEEKSIVFQSPSAHKRRSLACFTPFSTTKRKSVFLPLSSTPAPPARDLQKRLNEWLQKRGKNLNSFSHLKCFGLHIYSTLENEENKENIEIMQDIRKGSYEDLRIPEQNMEKDVLQKEEISDENLENVARAALADLYKLILEGYNKEYCEAWLGLIRLKHKNLEEEPQYWECRAAIEQARGNFSTAVECYRTAIEQGAEIKAVDESLDQLLQKFSLLNISTSRTVDDKSSTERARIIQDARNVFKSSIIQFAVQKRKWKRSEESVNGNKKYIATPVRRSTRLSRAAYTSTPGVKICDSLQELDASIRDMMDFKSNNAIC